MLGFLRQLVKFKHNNGLNNMNGIPQSVLKGNLLLHVRYINTENVWKNSCLAFNRGYFNQEEWFKGMCEKDLLIFVFTFLDMS